MAKSILRGVDDHGHHYEHLMFVCPGCVEFGGSGVHALPVSGDSNGKPMWTFDGNLEAPTLSPSILSRRAENQVCHSFLQAGVFQFLDDCTHSMAGQRVPMPDLHDWLERM
jgi:hypothetical protein